MNRFVLALLGASFLAACGVGPVGPAGPEGPPGPGLSAGASISSITPGRVYLGRASEVSIAGFGTEWTAAATVSFGANITVEGITVASPTGIIARIVVTDNATVGPRDVTVTEAGKTATFKGAFSVISPLVFPAGISLAQGELQVVEVKNLDLASAFDTTTSGNSYPNLAVVSDTAFGSIEAASSFGATLLLGANILAPAGDAKVTIESGAMEPKTKFTNPKAFAVTARTPTALSSGTPTTGTVATAKETHLYSFTSTTSAIVTATVTSTATDARPKLFGVPASGKFADSVGYASKVTIVAEANKPIFLVYWDMTEATGYTYTLELTSVATSVVPAEIEPNGTSAQAQVIPSAPVLVQAADLSDLTDIDYFAVTIDAADVGKAIHVRTLAGDASTDPIVEVLSSDGITSLGGPSDDLNYHEDFTSSPVTAAGVHYIKVYMSDYVTTFDPAESHYQLSVTLE